MNDIKVATRLGKVYMNPRPLALTILAMGLMIYMGGAWGLGLVLLIIGAYLLMIGGNGHGPRTRW